MTLPEKSELKNFIGFLDKKMVLKVIENEI
jgi:hypothetical protein